MLPMKRCFYYTDKVAGFYVGKDNAPDISNKVVAVKTDNGLTMPSLS